ncbi:VOC family protein [Neobacillus piezotolerans]|uniref:VOC family protein n=1 Tax=Neobacillus piezotolerans TaxID=2259171 RepID=A0A3D8GRN8_9BACI|nr:VOC family protein [Neobacillus piezotolerans]RDU37140.1 VOC family protein [Neobacillus piezotolerans]
MFNTVGQIMLYVNDQDGAVKFWTEKAGFVVKADETNGPMRWIEIAPAEDVQTTIVLHNKELIAKMEPELNLGTPSLMFFTDNLDNLYENLSSKNVTVGEIVKMPSGRVFNFADDESNYFAVMEKTK